MPEEGSGRFCLNSQKKLFKKKVFKKLLLPRKTLNNEEGQSKGWLKAVWICFFNNSSYSKLC